MMAISTTNIGISMIMVSLMAKLIGTLATAQDIMRHMPYGGVMRPKAKDTMPTMAKCTGCMPTDSASGCKVVPTMMMAGMASKKQPTTKNAPAINKPTPITPSSHSVTLASSALGIW